MDFQNVLDDNKRQIARARQLNVRAGQTVFPVMSEAEFVEWIITQSAGATSIAKISDPETLRLPSLNEELVTLVMDENPDQIEVFGTSVAVEYRAPYYGTMYAPHISLPESLVVNNGWLNLPDDAIRLPGGRLVDVSFSIRISGSWSSDTFSGIDLVDLKEQVKNHLNENQWNMWTTKPTIVLPDITNDNAVIPEIIADDYGRCVVTNRYLFGYGTIRSTTSSWNSSVTWNAYWTRDWKEVEQIRAEAVIELEKAKVNVKLERDRQAIQQRAETARQEFRECYSNFYYSDALSGTELQRRFYDRYYTSFPSDLAGLKRYAKETKDIMTEVRDAIAIYEKKKIEEAARMAKAGERLLGILQSHYAICPICGKAQEWTLDQAEVGIQNGVVYPMCDCYYGGNALGIITSALDQGATVKNIVRVDNRDGNVLYRSMIGDYAAVSMAVYYKNGQWNLALVIDLEAFRSDGKVVFEIVWHQPTEFDLELQGLYRLRDSYDDQIRQAEEELRSEWNPVRKLSFRIGKNPKSGLDQWEAGDRSVKYVVDAKSSLLSEIQPGLIFYCREGRALVDSGRFRLILVNPYLQAGRNIEAEIAALEAKIKAEYEPVTSPVSKVEKLVTAPSNQRLDLSSLLGLNIQRL